MIPTKSEENKEVAHKLEVKAKLRLMLLGLNTELRISQMGFQSVRERKKWWKKAQATQIFHTDGKG